jgi:NTE family protein
MTNSIESKNLMQFIRYLLNIKIFTLEFIPMKLHWLQNVVFICFAFNSHSQESPVYRNLVMEGGGAKGVAYGGALIELENRGVLKDIQRVGGSSAGAIQACLLAVGYTADEINSITANTPIESFNDEGSIAKKTKNLINEYGWYAGESFHSTIQKLIADHTGKPNLTFAELHELAKSYPYRDLFVTGTNLSKQKPEVFSHETYPNMRVCDAVRVSMSIPLYFKAVWVNDVGKIIENPKSEDACSLFVDGALLMAYPVSMFDNARFMSDSTKNEAIYNSETLGLRLERCEQIDHETKLIEGAAGYEVKDFESYMGALLNVATLYINPPKVEDAKRTIYINDAEMNSRIRKIPEAEKTKMLNLGRQGVIDFFYRGK